MHPTTITRGARVSAMDGEVGRVRHVIMDPQTQEISHIVVEKGRDEWPIPLTAVVAARGDRVWLRGGGGPVPPRGHFNRNNFRAISDTDRAKVMVPEAPAPPTLPAEEPREPLRPA